MKNFSRFSILAVALLALVGNATAVDLPTTATVNIVEGIEIVQVLGMNFGTLVRSPGVVDIATDGTFTDNVPPLTYDATGQSVSTFTVTSITDQVVTLAVLAGAPPAGLTLSDFVSSWDAGVTEEPAGTTTHTMGADVETLTLGATLTVDAAVVVGDAQELPYTVTVTLP